MKITLPLPPNLANSRMHWRVKHNKRKAYFKACDYFAFTWTGNQSRTLLDALPFDRTRIKATFYSGGRCDIDNLFARAKWPVDWLVQSGYLKGDSERHLVWEMPEQVVKRKQQYRVVFELEAA